MVKINNHFERAISLLANQFRALKSDNSLTNLQKVIQALITLAQGLEDVNWELKTERWLDVAIGQQLDEIGIILGLPRNPGESDQDYRERLRFQIYINTSSGTPENIISMLSFLTKGDRIWFHDLFPAAFQLETNGTVFPDPWNDLNEAIFDASPAGVNYAPIIATRGVEIPFELAGDYALEPLGVVPDEDEPNEIHNLQVEPYAALLYVQNGTLQDTGPEGGLDELGFPLSYAGQLSELIQKGGNAPPRR